MPDPLRLPTGPIDYYRVLDVAPDADQDAIRVAYRTLAKTFHPDRNGSALGRRLMLVVNEAYEALKTPDRRAVYDRSRRANGAVAQPVIEPRPPGREPAFRPAPAAPPISEELGPLQRRAAARRPDRPTGEARVLEFGRYAGRTIQEVARLDPDYLEWFIRTPLGRPFTQDVRAILR